MSDIPSAASLEDFFKDDEAHKKTDKIIEKMEKQIAKEYRAAVKEMTAKLKEYGEKFDKKDEAMRQKMIDGEITQKQYSEWRVREIATGDRYKAMIDTLAEDMARANDIAKSTINGHMEQVYSMNRNYATYQVEKDSMIDTSYTLYNRRSTEELFKNKKSLLPAPRPGTKAWQAAHDKDLRWNQQKINSSLIQGLLQGDSIPDIAKRLINVVGMNKSAAVRNARTMTTSIENKGRDDAYEELREKGIELDTVWVSTLDDRTRHSHRMLYGEVRDEETGKYSNGLRYPGDPLGDPEEVYNCRCCETSTVKGFPIELPRWSPKMGDMTFEEWLGVKEDGTAASILAPDTEGVMKGVPKLSDVSIPNLVKGANPDYDPDEYEFGTHANCAYTAVATDLRAQGYDVYANHRQKGENVYRSWWDRFGNIITGRGSFTDCFEGMKIDNPGATKSSNALKKTAELMKSYGDRSRAIIWVQWKGTDNGHYFNASVDGDTVNFIDGQSDKTDVSYFFERCKPGNITVFRTDNCKLTDFVHKVVSYGKDK